MSSEAGDDLLCCGCLCTPLWPGRQDAKARHDCVVSRCSCVRACVAGMIGHAKGKRRPRVCLPIPGLGHTRERRCGVESGVSREGLRSPKLIQSQSRVDSDIHMLCENVPSSHAVVLGIVWGWEGVVACLPNRSGRCALGVRVMAWRRLTTASIHPALRRGHGGHNDKRW